MASKKHHANGDDTTPPPAGDPPAGEPDNNTVGTTTETTHDRATGVIARESIKLLKKIVAKDIVPRKDLVYKKRAVTGSDGKVITNPDGSDRMEVVSPEPRMLYRVFGVASGSGTGESTYGPYVFFTGSFEAIRFSDRERSKSDKLFLQDPAEGLLLAALTGLKREDSNGTVAFAFDIGVKPSQRWVDKDEGNSYEYLIESKVNVQQNDPLAQLRGQVLDDLPALPAPTP